MATQNLIQIKRSENTAAPGSLANGELAFSGNGDILYIGNFGSVTAVGGARNPGALTANQALVANSTSGIDQIIVANLQPGAIYANGSLGTAGQVLSSNSTGVYWADSAAGSLSGLEDTNITSPADGAMLFYDEGTSNWIDNVISGDAAIADTGVLTLATVNDDAGTLGDANSVPQITIDAKGRITNAASVDINHDTLLNFVSNEHISHSSVTLSAGAGLTGGGDITTNRTFTVGAGDGVTVNADDVAINAQDGVVANSSGLFVEAGNSQIVSNSSGIFIEEGQINHDNLSGFVSNEHINHSTVSISSGNGLTGGGDITASRTLAVGAGNGITVGADDVAVDAANGISVTAGGVNVLVGNNQLVSNSTGVWITESNINHDNLSGFVSNEHIDHSSVTLTAGNGLTGGGNITANRSFAVGAANGISVSADAVAVDGANGVSVTADGVNVLAGNNQIVSNTTGIWIASVTAAQISDDIVLGTGTSGNYVATISGTANEVDVSGSGSETAAVTIGLPNDVTITNDLTVGGTLNVDGNLVVSGNTSTIDVTNFVVEDPLIHLASNNETSDILDIGFVGHYSDDAGVTKRHTGLFRDATDGEFHLFYNYVDAGLDAGNTSVIDIVDATYETATLEAYLRSGALVSNGTNVAITSNSTISVAITANTLALGTDLAVQYGGTGVGTFTTNGILFGNGASALQVTAAGTQYQVLQAGSGGVPEFGSLDGGTF